MHKTGLIILMLLLASAAGATTRYVPGDYATIQAGIDACVSGDIVEVTCGTYNEAVTITTSGITLRGASLDPNCVIVDGTGVNRALYVNGFSTPVSGLVIEGMSFTGATNNAAYIGVGEVDFNHCSFRDITNTGTNGAAVYLVDPVTHVTFTNCSFLNNTVGGDSGLGGAIFAWGIQPMTFNNCVFFGNSAAKGGGVALATTDAVFTNCTFSNNTGTRGSLTAGAIFGENADLTLTGCILAFSPAGHAVYLTGTVALAVNCCDIFGNADGDWSRELSGLDGSNGNFSADPQFCGAAAGDNLELQSDSPCVAVNHPQGGGTCSDIGAMPVGCQETTVQRTTWSAVKALY